MSNLTIIGFVVGGLAVIAVVALVVKNPHPSPAQFNVFRTVIALGGAGFALSLTGFLTVQLSPSEQSYIRAGGTLAVFVLLYLFSPATTIRNYSSKSDTSIAQSNGDRNDYSLEFVSALVGKRLPPREAIPLFDRLADLPDSSKRRVLLQVRLNNGQWVETSVDQFINGVYFCVHPISKEVLQAYPKDITEVEVLRVEN